jgi:dienelactone hydrolase
MKLTLIRFFVPFGLAFVLLACSSDTYSTTPPSSYRDVGPWATGVTTLMLADRMVEVWYPVTPGDEGDREQDAYFIRDALPAGFNALLPEDVNPPFLTDAYRDAPASKAGPFPLVLFAHGFASYRNQSTFLTTHLASWGFVVASVDYLERGLASVLGAQPDPIIEDTELTRMVVALLASENEREGGSLQGRVATDRIAITGHSAGGGTAIRFGGEPDVVTYIPLSAGLSSDSTITLPDRSSLWLAGSIDAVIEAERTADTYAQASAPARFVLIENMGHLGPSDICAIGDSGGGVVQIALDAGLPIPPNLVRLGTDGCQADALPVEDGWPTIRHFVTAQLRWAFGIDEEPVGLSQDVAEYLPEAMFAYEESL